jgi:hypothetical protein
VTARHRGPRPSPDAGNSRSLPWFAFASVVALTVTTVLGATAQALDAQPAAGTGVNLVANSGFEHGLDGWRPGQYPGQRLSPSSTAHSGQGAAKLTTTRPMRSRVDDRVNTVIGARAGDHYRATVWIRATSATSGALRIRELLQG